MPTEDVITKPDADDPLAVIRHLKPIECGEEAAKHFAFDTGYLNLNHGSYGTTPIEVMDVHRTYRLKAEARPDDFVRYQYRTHLLDEARYLVADYLEVPRETCVLVQNATIAYDTIMHNLVFQPGDTILCFDTGYPSFLYTAQYLSETTPAEVSTVQYTLPVSDQHICREFEATIEKLKREGKTAKIAVFDTINTLPGVRVPFERLTKICRANNILSFIDGAHGIGQFKFDLTALDPDFFTSNCHKWLHVPRPCGFLYVPVRNQHLVRATLPTGFNFVPQPEPPNFVANFASLSTLDDTPYLCIEAALLWRSKLAWNGQTGEAAIMGYTRELASKGGQVVASILDTEVLDNVEHTLADCSMVNVRLPLDTAKLRERGQNVVAEVARDMMKSMIVDYETAVNVFAYNNTLWARLSAQVYLTLKDFERAGMQLKQACHKFDRTV